MTVMMLVMLVLLGPRHPRVIYEYEPLPRSRYVVAVLALIILILCFTPFPIEQLCRRLHELRPTRSNLRRVARVAR